MNIREMKPAVELVDARGNAWHLVGTDTCSGGHVYSDDDGNLMDRADLDADPELGPATEVPR